MRPPAAPDEDPDDDEAARLPIFGTWRRIYAAVVVSALFWMALVALFSVWPY